MLRSLIKPDIGVLQHFHEYIFVFWSADCFYERAISIRILYVEINLLTIEQNVGYCGVDITIAQAYVQRCFEPALVWSV